MRIVILTILSFVTAISVPAQDIQSVVTDFSEKNELKHALVGFSLTDQSGAELASLNPEYSLAPASTQKRETSL